MHTIEFIIDHFSEHDGLMDCWLSIDGVKHHLNASDSYSPFLPLLYFLNAVRGQRFPARLAWDEEGSELRLLATAVAEDDPAMFLKIQHSSYDEDNNLWVEETWFEDTIDRDVFIQALFPALIKTTRYLNESSNLWQIPPEEVEPILETIKSGFPLRSDINAAQNITIKIAQWYKKSIFLVIRNGNELVLTESLPENGFFLQDILTFLEKIKSGLLLAEFQYKRDYCTIDTDGKEYSGWETIHFCAEPLPLEEHIRLIINKFYDDGPKFMVLNEVVERHYLAECFFASLRQYLKENNTWLESDYNQFHQLLSRIVEKLDS